MEGVRILLKEKDCTRSIKSIKMNMSGGYSICFNKKPSQIFTYRSSYVKILKRRNIIDITNHIVLIDGDIQYGINKVEDYGSFYILIAKNGYEISAKSNQVDIIGSCLDEETSKNKINYFKSVAYDVGLYREDGKNILGSYYEKLNFIRKDSILSNYLEGTIPNNYKASNSKIIFPFGFNLSQKTAVENAINNRLSIIQGPPGTGKTQTILNIMANLIKDKKTVAIVSNTNSATQNIYEKLELHNLEFIVAQLGSSLSKQTFIHNQVMPPNAELHNWYLDSYIKKDTYKTINNLEREIDITLDKQNKLAELKTIYDSINIESKHFKRYFHSNGIKVILPKFRKRVSSMNILDLWYKIERKEGKISFIDKIINFFMYGLKETDFYKQNTSTIISTLQLAYYEAKINELNFDINRIELFLKSNDIYFKIKKHTELSMKYFKAYISKRYLNRPKTQYAEIDLIRKSKEFMLDYPVVLSTTYSLRNSLDNNYMYDYVIIDEASQVDVATLVLALSCAKNAVIVGDQKQLPNVIDSKTKRHDEIIFSRYKDMPNAYKFSTHSALSSIIDVFEDSIPTQLLREHYRCDPKIIGFCNKMYYDNQLIVLTPENKNLSPLKVYRTVKGNHARDNVNERQIDVTIKEVIPEQGININDNSVGIVTPYRNHAKNLQIILGDKKILIATVDKFQGREKDTIIINTVDNKTSAFASNPNRLNVAVSRAKKQLIVVTNGNDNSQGTGIDELINYISYHQGEVIDSKVRSIFDNLYTSYYHRKIKKARRKSSPAEDLMLELLKRILIENDWKFLDIALEYPIKMMVDTSTLIGRDKQYVDNQSKNIARADFVIFSKTSKQPLLVIEVDGHKFHISKKQKDRDNIKNKLLTKVGMPLLRVSTTGSNEYDKIVNMLNKILKISDDGIYE